MPVIEWRGEKLRMDDTGTEMTLGQAREVKRFTGLRVVAFQNALQQMVKDEEIDPDLMQVFLWLLLDQNGKHVDISTLDDVPLEEFGQALASMTVDGAPVVVDPTPAAAGSDAVPPPSSNGDSTPTSTDSEPSTSSNSLTTAESPL